jgi:hypothetical protein
MRPLRLAVWCVVVLLVAVPAVRFAWTAPDGLPHHAAMKAPRSSPSGWRTVTAAPGLPTVLPVLAPRHTDPSPSPDRLCSIAPLVPFHPPRG